MAPATTRSQWDPGDGSDTVDGGTGADRLAFNGSNIGEVFDVSANGSHVRFTRNVAAITMDLVHIETLDVTALGGADVLDGARPDRHGPDGGEP